MGFNNNISPVKEGEEHNVYIESVGDKGDGVARIQGFVVFVPGVKEGDNVRIKITKVLQKVGFAEKIGDAKPEERKQRARKPKQEVHVETEEEKALFDTSKDTEDFGDDSEEESEEKDEDSDTSKKDSGWDEDPEEKK